MMNRPILTLREWAGTLSPGQCREFLEFLAVDSPATFRRARRSWERELKSRETGDEARDPAYQYWQTVASELARRAGKELEAGKDQELFENHFGQWLERHGVTNVAYADGFRAGIDLDALKAGIVTLLTRAREGN